MTGSASDEMVRARAFVLSCGVYRKMREEEGDEERMKECGDMEVELKMAFSEL